MRVMVMGLIRGLAVTVVGGALAGCAEGEKTITLPHGDTLTVPESYEFKSRLAFDSVNGTLQDGDGRKIFNYDACGIASIDFLAGFDIQEVGQPGRSVSADFFYCHCLESSGLFVMFPSRGRSAFVFNESVSDEAALALVKSLTAQTSGDSCGPSDP